MRIQVVEVTNYKAFFGTHKIKVGGKNLFIYGENGSGQSSLYYALNDFFQSPIEDIDLKEPLIKSMMPFPTLISMLNAQSLN